MKLSSRRAPLSPARARNCAILNQFATPGLGSLMARRIIAGAGQLVVFLIGFIAFLVWFVDVLRMYYGLMFSGEDVRVRYWLALAGAGMCALAWLSALFTSVSLLREAKRNEEEGKLIPS